MSKTVIECTVLDDLDATYIQHLCMDVNFCKIRLWQPIFWSPCNINLLVIFLLSLLLVANMFLFSCKWVVRQPFRSCLACWSGMAQMEISCDGCKSATVPTLLEVDSTWTPFLLDGNTFLAVLNVYNGGYLPIAFTRPHIHLLQHRATMRRVLCLWTQPRNPWRLQIISSRDHHYAYLNKPAWYSTSNWPQDSLRPPTSRIGIVS